MPEMPRIDEFAFILFGGVLFIVILMVLWSTPTETPPVFEPKTVELMVKQGGTGSFEIELEGKFTGVNLTATGDIKNWVTFNKNNFDVYEKSKVKVTVEVPESKPADYYSGRIIIESAGGTGQVSVVVEVIEETETVLSAPTVLGDFTVSYSKGTDTLDSKSDVTVSRGYLASSGLKLTGSISSDKLATVTDAYVDLDVQATNGVGSLIVLVNGVVVYNEVASTGTLSVPVNSSILGTSNTVEITASTPGFMFWTSTTYSLDTASFGINYKGDFSKTFNFELDSEKVGRFKSLGLSYRVTDYSTPLAEMMIKVNNRLVEWERPPMVLADYRFTEDIFGNSLYLVEGNNTISFSFDRQASYSVADAILTVYYYG